MKISVHGLGKLGLAMACVFAEAGHDVIGVDLDEELLEKISHDIDPHQEQGLRHLLRSTQFIVTENGVNAAFYSDVSFIIVPTPSDDKGFFRNDYVIAALEHIGQAIRDKNTDHTVVVTSTVMPESSRIFIPHLEKVSGKRAGIGFQYVYSPEFIALGTVIRDMKNPDFVLIGESSTKGGSTVESIYKSYLPDEVPVVRTSPTNAEIAKIALNTFVTTKISFANMVAEYCESVGGADASRVCEAIGHDSRIGSKYIQPATAYGGECFPRDSIAFSAALAEKGIPSEIAEATDSVNKRQAHRLLKKVREINATKVGVLGLSYKPDTPITTCSVGIKLVGLLRNAGFDVIAYDPMSDKSDTKNLQDCLSQVDTVVICTPWDEFKTANLYGKKVIDCWGVAKSGNPIIRIGVG